MEIELTNEDIKNTKIIYPEAKSTEQTPYQPRIPKRSYRWEPSLSQILNYDSVLMVRLVTEEVYRAELLNHASRSQTRFAWTTRVWPPSGGIRCGSPCPPTHRPYSGQTFRKASRMLGPDRNSINWDWVTTLGSRSPCR